MLIKKVKKVRKSQPHWHQPHNKKFVQHICTPHVLGTTIKHKYCINLREVRTKFAKNPKTVDGWVVRAFPKNRAKFARRAREVRAKLAACSGPWLAPV